MVIDRGAFLSGRYAKVYDEIVKVKEADAILGWHSRSPEVA